LSSNRGKKPYKSVCTPAVHASFEVAPDVTLVKKYKGDVGVGVGVGV
jgi:hypothetical protein